MRRSLKVTSWEAAEAYKRVLEGEEPARGSAPPPVTVAAACQKFYREGEARHLSEATLSKFRTLAKQLKSFASVRCPYLRQFTVECVRDFRATWKLGPRSAVKKLEELRAFFRFCMENEWIEKNPAALLRHPVVKDKPTLPFTKDEMGRILRYAGAARTFILTLRYTGMRISDAALLEASSVRGQRVFLYTQKTGVPVFVPIPEFLAEELHALPPRSGYLFLRGQSRRLDTCTDLWRRQLDHVFRAAGVAGGHPHRFRDTFAVELLLAGVSLEHVSILLGHSSIKVTEKHYSPWVQTRQDQLEVEVRRTWEIPKPFAVEA